MSKQTDQNKNFAANLGGSMDRGNVKDKASQSWGKQMSLHDELLSHERLTANEEMRRKIQKQQSLPDNNDQVRVHHMFSRILNFLFAMFCQEKNVFLIKNNSYVLAFYNLI